MTQERKKTGFTLIELLVVLAVIAMLLTIALPRYFSSLERSREAVLRQNLALMRETLDKYHADKGKYPAALDELVRGKYLRSMPIDPITESNTSWISIPAELPEAAGVIDVRSGAEGVALDGTEYKKW
jgi:general secretion pathway protein G